MKTVNQAPEHPSNEVLAAFALGKTTSNAETIAEHIANCARCETLLNKTPKDTFLGILNKAKPGSSLTGDYTPPVAASTGEELPDDLRRQSKYSFLKKLGGGGMGVVWLAEHNLMKRKVAIKLIPPELIGNSSVRERFLREVVSASALEHANVVRAYAAEEFGQHMIFEMEFVDGKDLDGVVKKKGPLPISNCVHYVMQAARGLQEASLKGLIHRDIKPHNLLLTRAGSIKVADFGLAKFGREAKGTEGRSLTAKDAMMGTPHFMAPEQARDAKNADIRADLYSLGCTLYYLLTGRPPFEGETHMEVIFAHVEKPAPDVRVLRPDAPPALANLLERLLAKKPEDRPQTPKEVADELGKIARDEPLSIEKPEEKSSPEKAAEPELPPIADPPALTKTGKKGSLANWLALAAAIAFLAASGFVIFQMKTREAILIVESEIPNPFVRVLGEEKFTLEYRDGGKKVFLYLKRGKEYDILLEKDGYKVTAQKVTLNEPRQTIPAQWVEKIKIQDYESKPAPSTTSKSEPSAPASDTAASPPEVPTITEIKLDKSEPILLRGHQNPVVRLLYTPDGSKLISASNGDHHEFNGNLRYHVTGTDNSVRIWDIASKSEIKRFEMTEKHHYGTQGMSLSPDGERLAVAAGWYTANGDSEPLVYVWDLASGTRNNLFAAPGSSAMRSVGFSTDGNRVMAVRSGPGGALTWSLSDNNFLNRVNLEKNGPGVESPRLTISPGCKYILGGLLNVPGTFCLWKADTGKVIGLFLGHSKVVTEVAISEDETRLVSCAGDGTVRIWECDSGKQLLEIGNLGGNAECVALSPDGKRLLTGGENGSVVLYNAISGAELSRLGNHQGKVRCLAFSANGKSAASGGDDGNVNVWTIPN